jgi:flagellar biosynthetic protein FliR
LNIFAIGFPMTMLIGFLLLWITLPDVLGNFTDLLAEALALVQRLVLITR